MISPPPGYAAIFERKAVDGRLDLKGFKVLFRSVLSLIYFYSKILLLFSDNSIEISLCEFITHYKPCGFNKYVQKWNFKTKNSLYFKYNLLCVDTRRVSVRRVNTARPWTSHELALRAVRATQRTHTRNGVLVASKNSVMSCPSSRQLRLWIKFNVTSD